MAKKKLTIIHGASKRPDLKFDTTYTCQDILDDVTEMFGVDPESRALVDGDEVGMDFVPKTGSTVEFQKATGAKA